MRQPNNRGSQGDERGEAFGELVAASGNAAELFDAAEEPLDQVVVFVLVAIKRPLDDTMAAWRDNGIDPLISQVIEYGVGVVCLVRTERVRLQVAQQG